jgi:O-antigen ligase
VALVLTDSQAAFFGVAAGVLAWPFIRLARFLSPILVVLILVVSSLALVSVLELQSTDGFLTRALAVTGYPYDNLSGRMALLETRFGAIADHPLTGVGLGQIGKYVDYMTGTDSGIVSHFTPIGILAETGVLGLLAVSFILIAFLRIMWGNAALNLANNSGWLQLNEGLTMAFIGIMVFGLAHDIQTNRTLWLVLALIVSLKPACLSDER